MPQFDPSTFTSQLFWLIISFSILYIIVSKFGIPRLNDILEQRQRVINDDLNYAENLNAEARQTLEEYNQTIEEAKQQASHTINETANSIQKIADQQKAAISIEVNAKIKTAEERISNAHEKARLELTDMVADAAIQALSHISALEISKDKAIVTVEKIRKDKN